MPFNKKLIIVKGKVSTNNEKNTILPKNIIFYLKLEKNTALTFILLPWL